MLAGVSLKPTKKGPMMAIVTLEDLDGSIEAVLFPNTLEKYREIVVVDAVLRIKAKLEDSDRGKKLIVAEFEPFDGAAFGKAPEKLTIQTDAGVLINGRREKLVRILQHYPGRDFVELQLLDEEGNTIVARMPQTVNREAHGLHAELIELFGGDAITEN
jgi:DNA polymerase-3 subunit alpha